MTYIAKIVTIIPVYVALILLSTNVKAQSSLLQQAVDKIESFKNFSYHEVNSKKELFIDDTVTKKQVAVFEKAYGDKNFGYLFDIKTAEDKDIYRELYNGKQLIYTRPVDSIYDIRQTREFIMQLTLPGQLKWLTGRVNQIAPQNITLTDTTINGLAGSHLTINVYDTIINKERNYTLVHVFIDKSFGLPRRITTTSRNTTYGNGASEYYSKTDYTDYKFDQPGIAIASMGVPNGFHQLVQSMDRGGLLPAESIAPDWTLYTSNGTKTSLAQLKGKVVLLDFFFIGCYGCMLSLKPLNNLYEKHKGKNFEIISLTDRDSARAVNRFKKKYNIKYPVYVNAADVAKQYNVSVFPTFYFIDKDGKIATTIIGHDKGFEERITKIVDGLLDK